MSKLMKSNSGFLTLTVMALLLMISAGCGPKQDSVDKKNEEIRSINEKEKLRLVPIVGRYQGTLATLSGKLLQVTLDVEIYSALKDGAGYGEENTQPMLRAFLNEVPQYDENGEVISPLPPLGNFRRSSYNEKTGDLRFFNYDNAFNGVEAKFIRTTTGEYRIEGYFNATYGTTKISVTKVTEE